MGFFLPPLVCVPALSLKKKTLAEVWGPTDCLCTCRFNRSAASMARDKYQKKEKTFPLEKEISFDCTIRYAVLTRRVSLNRLLMVIDSIFEEKTSTVE